MWCQPPKYTPRQLEKIKTKRSNSTGSKASNEPETSTILQSEWVETELNTTQEVESCLVHSGPEIAKVVHKKSGTSEFSDTRLTEPNVEHPDSELSQP